MSDCEKKLITQVDLARQANIITGNTACFDGKIQAGIAFSGYPTGVDLNTVTLLNPTDGDVQTAVLSGNNITTLFDVSNPSSPSFIPAMFTGTSQEGIPYSSLTWTNPLYSATTSGLTLPITIGYTGETTIGPYWDITISGMNGTHPIALEYSGYSIQYEFYDLFSAVSGSTFPPPSISAATYSSTTGLITATYLAYSAASLDYTGPLDYLRSKEDATIDNKLTTKEIRITEGASLGTVGYVLMQSDQDGTGIWSPSSGTTGFTNVFVTGGTLSGGDELILTRNDDVDITVDLRGLTGGTGVNYVNSASTTSTVGGITAGSTFPAPGKTMQEMWDLLLYPYQPPAFTSFNQGGLLSEYELGQTISIGAQPFTWGTSNSSNVDDGIPGSIEIKEADPVTTIGNSLTNDGTESIILTNAMGQNTIGSKLLYTIYGENTIGGTFSRTLSKTWKVRWYYGKNANTSVTSGQMTALSGTGLVTGVVGSYVTQPATAGGEYMYWCIPDILGQPTDIRDSVAGCFGTNIPYTTLSDIPITNAYGVAVNYKIYRSVNPTSAAFTTWLCS